MIVSDETSSINNQHSFQPRSPDYPSSPQVIKVAHYSVRDGFLPRLYLLTIFPLLLFSIGGIQVIVVTGTAILECDREIVIEMSARKFSYIQCLLWFVLF